MKKTADSRFLLHPMIAERWSPRAFAPAPVTTEELGSLMEAARWAPSCFNAQPWRFLVARREDTEEFQRLADCLVEGNAWAREAPLLLLSVARTTFERNGKPNRHAAHDVGLATMSLVLQAESMGLATHQMAGFDVERARETLGIPEGHDPIAMVAVGRPGPADALPEPLAEREGAPRTRKSLAEIAHGATWESALDALA